MRLALSSTAFDRTLAAGELTQLELLDHCAGLLGLDGVVLDLEHFPRRDADYLAQVKKFAADLALTLVAVRDETLALRAESDALGVAASLGAPYVLTRMPHVGVDPVSIYNEALAVLGPAVAEAKRVNVTIAVRNVPGSLASDAFELSRLRKEADSAWLRYALDVVAFPEAIEEKMRKRVVLGYHAALDVTPSGDDPHASTIIAALARFPGFLVVDYRGGETEIGAVTRLVRGWRRALAESVAEPHVPS